MCCKVYSIKELNKPAGQWCIHAVRGSGCSIHANRPRSCREFFCSWLIDPNLGPEWKPEVCRFVMSADPAYQALTLMVDPGMPLGPALLSTWLTLPGPQVRTANRSPRAATMAAIAAPSS